MDPGAILERFLERPRVAFVRAVLDAYGRAAGGLLANGLAFAALFADDPDGPRDPGARRLAGRRPTMSRRSWPSASASRLPAAWDLIEVTLLRPGRTARR